MLQVVKVFVTTGSELQLAQPSQGNKSQIIKLNAVGKNFGHGRIGKAGDVVVKIEKTKIGGQHHQVFAAYVGWRHRNKPFLARGRVSFVADPAGVDGLKRTE